MSESTNNEGAPRKRAATKKKTAPADTKARAKKPAPANQETEAASADATGTPSAEPRFADREVEMAQPVFVEIVEEIVLPYEQVCFRAYQLFVARGGLPGHELEDWLEAERDLKQARRGSADDKASPAR